MSYSDFNYHNENDRAARLKKCSEQLEKLNLEITKKSKYYTHFNTNLNGSSSEYLKTFLWTKISELDIIDTENDMDLRNTKKIIHSNIKELLDLYEKHVIKYEEQDKNIIVLENSKAPEIVLNIGEEKRSLADRLKNCAVELESIDLEITTKARGYFAYYKSSESASFDNVKTFLWTKLSELDMINTENDPDLRKIKKNLHLYINQLLESNGTNIKKKEEIDKNIIKNPQSLEKILNIRKEAEKISEEIDECDDEDAEDKLDDLNGSLLNLMVVLDEVNIEGDEVLRAERKKTLIYIQNLIDTIESKLD